MGTINLNGPGTLALKNDGDGTESLQTVNFLENVVVASNSTITVARAATAANKDLQLGTLSIGYNQLNVTNSNGFSLEFTGSVNLTGADLRRLHLQRLERPAGPGFKRPGDRRRDRGGQYHAHQRRPGHAGA